MKFDPISLCPAKVKQAEKRHAQRNRTFQGIPSIERIPSGRLFAVWYSGGNGEGSDNYVCLAISDDDGVNWSEVLYVIEPVYESVRTFDSEIWYSPDGRLFIIYAQSTSGEPDIYDGKAGVWICELKNPAAPAEQFEFGQPRRISDGIMMCKPLVLSDGTWAFPCACWSGKTCKDINVTALNEGEFMMVSTDGGTTFSERGKVLMDEVEGGATFDEHMFMEKKDGTLITFSRVRKGISSSISSDKGCSWSAPEIYCQACESRFFIRKLQSGNWLLVRNDTLSSRTNLTAFLSDDEGKTWKYKLLLDGSEAVSYPDGFQAQDGSIYVIYDRDRFKGGFLHLAKFTEEDIRNGTEKNIRKSLVSSSNPVQV